MCITLWSKPFWETPHVAENWGSLSRNESNHYFDTRRKKFSKGFVYLCLHITRKKGFILKTTTANIAPEILKIHTFSFGQGFPYQACIAVTNNVTSKQSDHICGVAFHLMEDAVGLGQVRVCSVNPIVWLSLLSGLHQDIDQRTYVILFRLLPGDVDVVASNFNAFYDWWIRGTFK